jgi:hypothetical protein
MFIVSFLLSFDQQSVDFIRPLPSSLGEPGAHRSITDADFLWPTHLTSRISDHSFVRGSTNVSAFLLREKWKKNTWQSCLLSALL